MAPFSDTPDQRMFWGGHGCQQIFNSLLQSIIDGASLQTVIAEPGLGKTMLCRKLLNSLKSHKSRFRALYLPCPEQDFDDALIKDLLRTPSRQRRTVLLLDEAQALPEEFLRQLLRWLTTSEPDSGTTQAVLFGQPELEQLLDATALKPLADLRTANHEIQPFNRSQILAYLNDRLDRAGEDPTTLLDPKIVETVWHASGGVPRIANTIMRKALLAARNDDSSALEHHHILSATSTTDAAVS
ncbi:ExeA family protein [Pseudohongiella acticola]|uniref:ExeA family protein n=1 Tax=Pseudohongiella acticola TaxID=1524254 RepID=UPI0030EF7B9D